MAKYYDELLKLCGFEEEEIGQERPRIEEIFRRLELGSADMKSAESWVRQNHDVELVGVRKMLRLWLKELFDLVLARDEEKKIEYRRVDHYRTETKVPILTPPFADKDSYTLTYHRPLESYFAALSNAGFAVNGLEEWISNKKSQPGKRAKAENRSRKEIPLFLALRAKLIG